MSKTTSDYKKLKTKWYAKLKKSGFEDIEDGNNNLKSWSSKFVRQKSIDSWRSKESYYHMATGFLNSHKFESNLDKVIWEYHTNAISVRSIAKLLNKTKVLKTNRTTVWQIIKRLRKIMQK